jgi:nicotinic acid mononucleotide adenylyltransferase
MCISPHMLPHLKKVQDLLNQLHPQLAPQALMVPGSALPRGDIIVFTGSFNPPTIAHLALLKQAQRFAREQGDQPLHLYAAFSKRTVDKEGVERPLLLDRILLLQTLLRKRLPHVGILLFNRGLYVEQVEAMRASFPRVRRIFFLMGFDKIEQILDPRYYEDRDEALQALFRQAEILVAPRGKAHERGQGPVGKGLAPFQSLRELLDQPQNRRFVRFIHALPFDPLYKDISSTRIRQNGTAYAQDVPQEVRQFMKETRAYAPPVHRADGSMVDVYAARERALSQLLQGPVS